MRWTALALLLALTMPAGAQPTISEAAEAVAGLATNERAAAAQRFAVEIMGPRPTAAEARRAYDRAVEQRRQLIMDGVAGIERRKAEEWRRVQAEEAAAAERRRALELCRTAAPSGSRHWEYVHACYGQRR